jgi:hypothetical protein
VIRTASLLLTVGLIGAAFGLIRNQHIRKGDEIRQLEASIAECEKEIEMWELRIAGLLDRPDLTRRLRWCGSDLKEIEPERVLELSPTEELPALPKVALAGQ